MKEETQEWIWPIAITPGEAEEKRQALAKALYEYADMVADGTVNAKVTL